MVAKRFRRPPEVAAALAELPPETDPEYLPRLREVLLEALIIERRRARRDPFQRRINDIVVERILPLIGPAVREHTEPSAGEDEDVEARLTEMFWREILNESFFEVQFDSGMRCLAERAARSVRGGAQREAEREAVHGLPGIDYEQVDPNNMDERVETIMLIDAGLRALPRDQARVLIARHWLGLPISSQDPRRVTVGKLLGWSERSVHSLLRAGSAGFKRWVDEHDPDD